MNSDPTAYLLAAFEKGTSEKRIRERGRRIGSELKFPLVEPDGGAAGPEAAEAFWGFLISRGWTPLNDTRSGKIIGAVKQGEMNEHRVSCETGFCTVEFSLAHVRDLHRLQQDIHEVRRLMTAFGEEYGVRFLGYGIQPVTPPGRRLTMEKGRNLFWDRIFGGNRHILPEEGTDVHLFTISASNQVHIDVTMEEAIDAVNVFNGIAGGQVALTAHSNIWKGGIDPSYKCLGEVFWDWWLHERHDGRYGVPERKFRDLEDYMGHILSFPPVFVRRRGIPVALPYCPTFSDFAACTDTAVRCEQGVECNRRCGLTTDGHREKVTGREGDIGQHFTFFWHSARLSRYFTLENRINDQQPPGEMMTIPALTLGIMENLPSALDLVNEYPWDALRALRIEASRRGLDAVVRGIRASDLSRHVLDIAWEGLHTRGMREEVYLEPLRIRHDRGICPADAAAAIFREGGAEGLVERLTITP